MATLSQMPPTLHVTSADDDMEISSQLGGNDNDIDIDLDLHSETAGEQDNDVQLEDARSEAGSVMQTQDEEMIQDYDNPMYDGHDGADATTIGFTGAGPARALPSGSAAGDFAETYDMHFEDGITEEQPDLTNDVTGQFYFDADPHNNELETQAQNVDDEDVDVENNSQCTVKPHRNGTQNLSQLSESGASAADPQTSGSTVAHSNNEPAAQDEPAGSNTALHEGLTGSEDIHEPDAQVSQPEQLEQGLTASAQDEQQAAATTQGVERVPSHPILVSYDDSRFALFPPTHDEETAEFLLHDSSLVYRSLAELLSACREVLGQDVSDELELRFVCPDLGLEIGEESPHAFSTSMSEILDVFVDLHRLDGVERPEALEVTLEKRERFTAGLSRLRASVADGRGMSRLWDTWNDDETHADGPSSDENAEQKAGEAATEPSDHKADEYGQDHSDLHAEELLLADDPEGAAVEERAAEVEDSRNQREREKDHLQLETSSLGNTGEAQHETRKSEIQLAGEEEADPQTTKGDLHAANAPEEEEEDIIDYSEDEADEEVRSSDSSTVVGDATIAVKDEDKVEPKAQTNEDNAAEDEALHDTGGVEDGEEGAARASSGSQSLEEPQDDIDQQGDKDTSHPDRSENGAALDDSTENADLADADHPDLALDVSGHDHVQNGDAINPETWDELLEHDTEQDLASNPEQQESSHDETLDLGINSDALAAGEDEQPGETDGAPANAPFDEEDEITFDDEDAAGLDGDTGHGAQPSIDELPDQSLAGKRSFEEHLQGDNDGDGSDLGTAYDDILYDLPTDGQPEAKRLRST